MSQKYLIKSNYIYIISYRLIILLILSILCRTTKAALISAQSKTSSEDNETDSALSFLNSSETDSYSISENSVLTDPQSIKLKEIRKLARLAGHEHPENITDFDKNMCYQNACLETAKEFFSSMDFSKDPCTEWTKFACEWRTLSSKSALNQQSELELKNENQVLDILQNPNIETDRLRYANLYYSTCKNWFQEFNQVSQITAYLERFGNWPLLNGGDFEGDWVNILTEILRSAPENVSPFLLKLDAAAVNDDKIVLQIDSGTSYIEMDSGGLRELLQRLRTPSRTFHEKDLDDIKEMETTMKILSTAKFNEAAEDNPTLIKLKNLQDKLKAEIPNLKLNINSLIQAVFVGTDMEISDETEVLIDVAYISKYFAAIQSVSETNLANILFLQLAIMLLGDTTNMLDIANFPYLSNRKREFSGSPSYICLVETLGIFNYALSEEYVRHHYNQGSNEMTNKIIEILKIGFVNTISSIKWLEADSKTFIEGKVKNMSARVGFPEWIIDESSLVSYYSNLQITENITGKESGNYIAFRQTALAWLNGKSWKMKLNDDIMDSWNYKQINGFVGDSVVEYIPNLNQIRIPAGALQMPLFSVDYPGFMNFGGIGSIIAREMARVIDSKGITLNSDGEPGMWLDENSYKSYISWSMRLKKEWGSLDEPNLNDKLISVIAYHITVEGYKEYLKIIRQADQEESQVPGLISLQPEKLLQIKYTNVLCEDQNIRSHQRDWSSRSITGRQGMIPVAQSEYFFKLFQCNADRLNTAFDFV